MMPGSAPQPPGNNETPEGQEEDRGAKIYYEDGCMYYPTQAEPEDQGRGWTSTKPNGQSVVGPDQMNMKTLSRDDGNLTSEFKDAGLQVVP